MTPEELFNALIDNAIESAAAARTAYQVSNSSKITDLDGAIIHSLSEIAGALSAIKRQLEAHRSVPADIESHETRLGRLEERGRERRP